MPTEKPRSQFIQTETEAVTEGDDFWSRQFLKHFELGLLDAVAELPESASLEAYQQATVSAVIQTLVESGMPPEAFVGFAAKALASLDNVPKAWLPVMNDRRMELIDLQIQESITVAEQIELAQLTETMRAVVDSEANLPMERAKALHRKLLSIRRDETND